MGLDKMICLCVGILVILQCLHAFSLRDTSDSDIQSPAVFQPLNEEFLRKHPDLQKWFERAMERLQNRRNATEQDIEDVRSLLHFARKQVYDFVTSPVYTISTNLIIEHVLNKAEPILGIVPLSEVAEFYDITSKSPNLTNPVFEGDKDLASIVAMSKVLREWFFKTSSVIAHDLLDTPSEQADD